jgi:hypothetical protein
MTAFVSRVVTHEVRSLYRSGAAAGNTVDEINSMGLEGVRFIGPFDVMARLVLAVDLDRNFLADRANMNFVMGVRQNF